MRRFLFLVILLLLLPATGTHAQADNTAAACVAEITGRVSQQQRLFRAVLFGRVPAATEPEGAVRYNEKGEAWIKTGNSRWASATSRDTKTDGGMDSATEWDGMNEPGKPETFRTRRQGIFQTPKALTSDLVPSALEAYRALQCRLAMVCDGVLRSGGTEDTLEFSTTGCAVLTMTAMQQCRFANAAPPASAPPRTFVNPADEVWIRKHCQPLMEQVLQDERRMLTLAVSYDAAIRSLLQFSGQFDTFLESWRGDVLVPLRQTVSLVQQMTRIPCFLSQCTNE